MSIQDRDSSAKSLFYSDIILTGYVFAPQSSIREYADTESKNMIIIAILQMLGRSLLLAMAFLAMIDGPEVVKELLQFNFLAHSMFLYGYVINSLLFLWGIVMGIGWLLPFLLYIIQIRGIQKNKTISLKKIMITSCYAVLPLLMLIPGVVGIAMLAMSGRIEFIQFELGDWQNIQFYISGVILIGTIFSSVKLNDEVLGLEKAQRLFVPIIMFILCGVSISLFFIL